MHQLLNAKHSILLRVFAEKYRFRSPKFGLICNDLFSQDGSLCVIQARLLKGYEELYEEG